MRILFDHQAFGFQNYGGISRYIHQLASGINSNPLHEAKIAISLSNNYYLNSDPSFKKQLSEYKHPLDPVLKNLNFRGRGRIYNLYNKISGHSYSDENYRQAIELIKEGNFDVFHPTYYHPYFLDYIGNKPYVITAHDMVHELFAEYYPHAGELRRWKRRVVERASAVIAISNCTRQDVLDLYNIEPDRIHTVYHAVAKLPEPQKPALEISKYIVFIGNRLTYKNFPLFARVFALISKKYPDLKLLCVGGDAFKQFESDLLDELGITERVVQLNPTDAELAYIYSKALACIYPSLYEGFGLPLLEAFSAGCPMICSNTGPLPEVARDSAVLFDPKSVSSMYNAIDSVLGSAELREELKTKGFQTAKHYTESKLLEATIKVYESLL